jgi:hypothetical protein
MIYISHRGNINGRNPEKENTEPYVKEALHRGYDVEVDVWCIGGKWFLGHDAPDTETTEDFIRTPNLWIHCKNHEALSKLTETFRYGFPNCFFHDTDEYTLTTTGYIWAYPGSKLCHRCICVMPERVNYTPEEISLCYGICSDFVEKYK